MSKVKIIAEIGSVHDGSFGNALQLIKLASVCGADAVKLAKAASESGADAVKFQTHISSEETLKDAPSPSYFNKEPRFEYFERTSFSFEEWKSLKKESEKLNIEFLSSPFSIKAVDLLEKLEIDSYKIPSGEVTNLPLLQCVASTNKPIYLSSGMSDWTELDSAVDEILNYNSMLTVLQCTSEYPCKDENLGLNIITEMSNRYNLPVGLSDHSITNYGALVAVYLGASVIEKHLTFSNFMYGSDAKNSLEPDGFEDLCKGVRAIEKIKNNPVDKNIMAEKLSNMKNIFEKSLVSLVDIKKGMIIKENMIGLKKPGGGIKPRDLNTVIGKVTRKDIKKDSQISFDHLISND